MTYDNWEERQKTFAPNALPTSIRRKIYTHYEADGRISIWDTNLSNSKRILLCEQFVTVKIPDNMDLKQSMIDALTNEIKETQAEAYKKVTELQEKINSLLALEYKPGA